MPLPTSSLAKICNAVRGHIDTLGHETSPVDWDVSITVGAPGVNLAGAHTKNTLNLFFYRFESFGFRADARPGEVQWLKTICIITAFGIDEDVDNGDTVDYSAGFNELRMLSQVIRLFQEQPVMLIPGDDAGEFWHTQFVPHPLMDEQINQIWSSQGNTVYRPSVAYEITLVPVEQESTIGESTRVASIGTYADTDMQNRHKPWPVDRETLFPAAISVPVDTANPQWAPAIVMVTGPAENRTAALSLNFELPGEPGDPADFSSFPVIDIWIAGDTAKPDDLHIVGQLLQNPDRDKNSGRWSQIIRIDNISADDDALDMDNLPAPSPGDGAAAFILRQSHWTGLDNTNHSWQLQLFAERRIQLDPVTNTWLDASDENTGLRIRSNPILITINREES